MLCVEVVDVIYFGPSTPKTIPLQLHWKRKMEIVDYVIDAYVYYSKTFD